MMSCQEAARLISEERDHPLPTARKLGLKMHLLFCALCRGYKKNLEELARIASRAGHAVLSSIAFDTGDQELALSATSKQRIKDALEEEASRH
jgi:hypothetical protein